MAKKAVILTEQPPEQAVRKFTDRDEPRKAFWRMYNEVQEELKGGIEGCNLHVLTYYGFGGIGKTRLAQQLCVEMDERLSDPVYVYYDFKKNQESLHALIEIQNSLVKKADFTFPLFEYGLYFYTLKTTGKADSPEVKKLLDKSPVLKLLFSVVGIIPIAGTIEKLVSVTDDGVATIRNYINKNRAKAYALDRMDAEELYTYLPQLFILDMQRNLKGRTQPVVILLDTYEALVNELSQLGDPLKNDEWLRCEDSHNLGVILGTPGVLWVITGREKLKWPDWDESLEQHLLGSLSATDAMQFLDACGISDKKLQEGLWRLTDGIPVYLDLCVNCYEKLLENEEEPELSRFGNNKRELVTRFVTYASDSQKDNIFMLACLHNWTDDLVKELAREILPNFSPTTYAKTLELSFVNTSDEGYYHIHQVVEDVLVETCPEMIRTSAGKALLDKFLPVLQSKEYAVQDFANALFYAVRGTILCYPKRKDLYVFFKEKIRNRMVDFINAGHFRQAKPAVELLEAIVGTDKPDSLYAETLDLRSFLAHSLGNYIDAHKLGQELLEWRTKHLGENHFKTITAMRDLALSLDGLGQYQDALELKKIVLEKRRTILGEDHLETISAMNNLALTLDDLGQYQEALELKKGVLEKRRTVLGENHPKTIRAMNNLGITLTELGQHQEALELKKIVLEKHRAILGEDHPETISAMNNLALTLDDLGQHQEALELKKIVLEKRRTIFGEDHPQTINAMNNLATSLGNLGQHREAHELRKVVLEKRCAILGEDHPETINAMNNLSITLSALGQHQEVLELKKVVLEKRRMILGEDHPKTINAMNNLGSTLSALGQHREALELKKVVLEKRCTILGEDHPDTIKAMNSLSSTLDALGQYQEVLVLDKVVLKKQRAILGENHPMTIAAMNNLSITLSALGQHREALELRKAVLEKRRTILGEDHPETISAMHNLGCTLSKLGQHREALELRKAVLEKRRTILGEDHPNTINAMNNLGITLSTLGQHQEALELQKVVLTKRCTILGEDHPDTIKAMNSLSSTLDALGQYQEVLVLEKVVLKKQRAILGEDHPMTIRAMNNLGITLSTLGQHREALELTKAVLEKRRTILGEDHPETISAMHNLGCTLSKLGQHREALALTKAVLEKRRTILGEDHPDTIKAMNNLAIIRGALEDDIELEAMHILDDAAKALHPTPWQEKPEEGK